jgi:hypothetical protein
MGYQNDVDIFTRRKASYTELVEASGEPSLDTSIVVIGTYSLETVRVPSSTQKHAGSPVRSDVIRVASAVSKLRFEMDACITVDVRERVSPLRLRFRAEIQTKFASARPEIA